MFDRHSGGRRNFSRSLRLEEGARLLRVHGRSCEAYIPFAAALTALMKAERAMNSSRPVAEGQAELMTITRRSSGMMLID